MKYAYMIYISIYINKHTSYIHDLYIIDTHTIIQMKNYRVNAHV